MTYSTPQAGASLRYPNHPGSRDNAPETSRQAADAIAPMARNHREQILAVFRNVYPESRSSEQIANAIGLSVYSIRPRVSELVAAKKVEETTDRTTNDRGHSVTLWRALSL